MELYRSFLFTNKSFQSLEHIYRHGCFQWRINVQRFFLFFTSLSNPQATKNRMAGSTIHNQTIRKLAIQRPFRMTHASSRRDIITMAMIAPRNSHLQARANARIATNQNDNKNQSSIGTGSVTDGSGVRILRSTNRNNKALQMRAIQRMILMEAGLTCTLRMADFPSWKRVVGWELFQSTN
jgi:hypothetical protein